VFPQPQSLFRATTNRFRLAQRQYLVYPAYVLVEMGKLMVQYFHGFVQAGDVFAKPYAFGLRVILAPLVRFLGDSFG